MRVEAQLGLSLYGALGLAILSPWITMAVVIIVGASPRKGVENQKNASRVCEILSHLNKILIPRCYHIHWQLARILGK